MREKKRLINERMMGLLNLIVEEYEINVGEGEKIKSLVEEYIALHEEYQNIEDKDYNEIQRLYRSIMDEFKGNGSGSKKLKEPKKEYVRLSEEYYKN